MNSLDKKDMRLLDALDKNARTPSNQLAKHIGVSKQVLHYRLNKLLENNTIYKPYTIIDPGTIGFACYRLHVRVKNIPHEQYREFAKNIFEEHATFWVAFISGTFDIVIDVFAKDANHFKEISKEIAQKHRGVIQSYDTLVLTELNICKLNYYLSTPIEQHVQRVFRKKPPVAIDKADTQLLLAIKDDARMNYTGLEEHTNLTRNANKARLQNLEDQNIIVGYQAIMNFRKLGYNSHKVLLKFNTSKIEQESELLEYITQQRNVLSTAKLLGKWDADIDLHTKNGQELQEFIIELRSKFPIIEDYEICEILEDYGLNFFPEKLTEYL